MIPLSTTSPILIKELRTLLRSRKAFVFLLISLLLTGGAFCLFWMGQGDNMDLSRRTRFSRELFTIFSALELCCLGLISPILTAGAITGEREERTLDLLFCTGLSRLHIILGKWFSTIAYQILLVVCLAPVLALAFQLGGLGTDEYLFAAVMIGLTVATYSMVGLAWSAWLRRSVGAMFASLITIVSLGFLIFFSVMILSQIFHLYFFQNINKNQLNWLAGLPMACSPLITWTYCIQTNMRGAAGGAGGFAHPLFVIHVVFQGLLFCFATFMAWWGLARRETARLTKAQRIIDDPEALRQRRRRFPYYLVDPLKRAEPIADGQNPAYAKEQRSGTLARTTRLMRLSYLGLFFSVFACGPAMVMNNYNGAMSIIAQMGLCFMLAFAPIMAATGLSKEREEDTLALLLSSPLSGAQIIGAKFRSSLRPLAALVLSVMLVPLGLGFFFWREPLRYGGDLFLILLQTASFIALYAAVGLYCSSFCKRSLAAIVMHYIVLLLMVLSPFIVLIGWEITRETLGNTMNFRPSRDDPGFFNTVLHLVCPFLSPFYTLDNVLKDWRVNLNDDRDIMLCKNWLWALVRSAGVGALAWGLLRRATRRLEKLRA